MGIGILPPKCKLALLWIKVKKFLDFPISVKLGVGSGSESHKNEKSVPAPDRSTTLLNCFVRVSDTPRAQQKRRLTVYLQAVPLISLERRAMLARLVRGMTSSPSTRETVKSSLSLAASAESRPPGGEYAKHRTPLSGYLHLWATENEIFNVQLCKIKV